MSARRLTASVSGVTRDLDALSPRERQVLRLIALGHTNREVAGLLAISVRTAETHRANVVRKLGLARRAELVRYALASGLLDTSDSPQGSISAS
jgi:two-component system, NarL family, response regulator NreC